MDTMILLEMLTGFTALAIAEISRYLYDEEKEKDND